MAFSKANQVIGDNINPLPTTRWEHTDVDDKISVVLSAELGLHPVVGRVLACRSFQDPESASKHLFPRLIDLHNPFLMKDMKVGVDHVISSLHSKKKIVIFGDYDADGITSLVILYKFLRDLGALVSYYVPDRIKEGYGLTKGAVEKIRADGAGLLITVDCGIANHEEISFASSIGLETVVLDHHEVAGFLPKAVAVINTNRGDCPFPFKQLAGVGIVFNFLIALRARLKDTGFWKNKTYPNLKEYLDLVAIGTVGDICPLVDENRIFSKVGVELINSGKRVGLKALREICGLGESPVDSTALSFSIIPRLNAAGRVASAGYAVRLLLTEDRDEALALAKKLDEFNKLRQELEQSTLREIVEYVDCVLDLKKIGAIVLSSNTWHPGVLGIVASKLTDLYYRPVILISVKDGIGKGSGRSIPTFNIHQGLTSCSPLLLSHGGHRFAAGVSLREKDIARFAEMFDRTVLAEIDPSAFVPQLKIDSWCELRDITFKLIADLELLAPFGHSNPEPVLCTKNVSVSSPSVVGNNHLRMLIKSEAASRNSIWFRKGQYLNFLPASRLDIAFTPQLNRWNGTESIRLKVKDLALSV